MNLSAAHLDALVAAGVSAEQIVALIKADMAEHEKKLAERRQKDAQRQRRRRAGHAVSRDVTRTGCDPLKSNIKPQHSEANASGVEPPADPIKQVYDLGVAILVSTGTVEKQARALLGKWRRAKGDAEVLTALLECRNKAISDPVPWMEKRLRSAKWVSKSGYEYRGSDEDVMRQAEKRGDMDTYWSVKGALSRQAA